MHIGASVSAAGHRIEIQTDYPFNVKVEGVQTTPLLSSAMLPLTSKSYASEDIQQTCLILRHYTGQCLPLFCTFPKLPIREQMLYVKNDDLAKDQSAMNTRPSPSLHLADTRTQARWS